MTIYRKDRDGYRGYKFKMDHSFVISFKTRSGVGGK